MKLTLACLLSLCFVSFAAAGNLAGHWTGQAELNTPDGTVHTQSVFLDLKQDGEKVTGTGGSQPDESLPLEYLRFEGGKLSFTVNGPDGVAYKSTLVLVSDNRMEGKLNFTSPEGNELTAKLTFERQPAK